MDRFGVFDDCFLVKWFYVHRHRFLWTSTLLQPGLFQRTNGYSTTNILIFDDNLQIDQTMIRQLTALHLLLLSQTASSIAQSINTARRLDGDDAYFQYDLSQFSLRFEKCQYVKMYDDDMAQDEDRDTPLALRHFVLFNMCPTDSCDSSCVSSGSYGRYVTDVQTYLQYTVENQQRYIEDFCESCNENCQNNNEDDAEDKEEAGDDGLNDDQDNNNDAANSYDCSCVDRCDRYDNLEDYGYVDASQYIQCQEFQQNNNNKDGENDENENNNNNEDGSAIYIGPRCSTSGTKVSIGVFSDEDCAEPLENVDLETLLGAKLSYHLLTHSYDSNNKKVCLSCAEQKKDNEGEQEEQGNNEQQGGDDAVDSDEVNEMCEGLYNSAAKCESKTGLQNGFIQTAKEEDEYENQSENEVLACTFIDSLNWRSYTETGEINVQERQHVVLRETTYHQKIALGGLTVVIVTLLGLMEYFRQKIESVGPRVELLGPKSTIA